MAKVPEETMAIRRRERLRHVNIFMSSKALETSLGRGAVLSLLTGWFQNSHWRTAWWVIGEGFHDLRVRWEVRLMVFWHMKIMRRTSEEMEEIFTR